MIANQSFGFVGRLDSKGETTADPLNMPLHLLATDDRRRNRLFTHAGPLQRNDPRLSQVSQRTLLGETMGANRNDVIRAGDERSGAVFSSCRRYRYRLWRRWAFGPSVLWILLNPSTADERSLDPTVTRCRNFSQTWGFAAFDIVNLFAWRAIEPADLFRAHDPVGSANDAIIQDAVDRTGFIVLAWGNHGLRRGRARDVLSPLAKRRSVLYCLRLTSEGQPAHPLYLPGICTPMPYKVDDRD